MSQDWRTLLDELQRLEMAVIEADLEGVRRGMGRLVNYVSFLRNVFPDHLSESERRMVAEIIGSLQRVNQLIRQQLDFVQIWMKALQEAGYSFSVTA